MKIEIRKIICNCCDLYALYCWSEGGVRIAPPPPPHTQRAKYYWGEWGPKGLENVWGSHRYGTFIDDELIFFKNLLFPPSPPCLCLKYWWKYWMWKQACYFVVWYETFVEVFIADQDWWASWTGTRPFLAPVLLVLECLWDDIWKEYAYLSKQMERSWKFLRCALFVEIQTCQVCTKYVLVDV